MTALIRICSAADVLDCSTLQGPRRGRRDGVLMDELLSRATQAALEAYDEHGGKHSESMRAAVEAALSVSRPEPQEPKRCLVCDLRLDRHYSGAPALKPGDECVCF
jgi:hypothetical protein